MERRGQNAPCTTVRDDVDSQRTAAALSLLVPASEHLVRGRGLFDHRGTAPKKRWSPAVPCGGLAGFLLTCNVTVRTTGRARPCDRRESRPLDGTGRMMGSVRHRQLAVSPPPATACRLPVCVRHRNHCLITTAALLRSLCMLPPSSNGCLMLARPPTKTNTHVAVAASEAVRGVGPHDASPHPNPPPPATPSEVLSGESPPSKLRLLPRRRLRRLPVRTHRGRGEGVRQPCGSEALSDAGKRSAESTAHACIPTHLGLSHAETCKVGHQRVLERQTLVARRRARRLQRPKAAGRLGAKAPRHGPTHCHSSRARRRCHRAALERERINCGKRRNNAVMGLRQTERQEGCVLFGQRALHAL